MNVERLLRVKEAIGVISYFNMDCWNDDAIYAIYEEYNHAKNSEVHDCGTVACIGGTAGHLMMSDDPKLDVEAITETDVFEWLGLNHVHHYSLFYPRPLQDWDKVTVADAEKAIDNIIKFNDPKWAEIRPDLV